MRVIGIDPAPAKKSTVFDGSFYSFTALELIEYLNAARDRGPTLVCWDAPLTGPMNPMNPGKNQTDFSQRLIEQFFSREATGFKTPPGISVRPYSGCPHWAISRAVLGLPRVGPWDAGASELPFLLLASDSPPDQKGAFVVEVHPAVAAWLWCKTKNEMFPSWEYKKEQGIRERMWYAISPLLPPEAQANIPKNDDQFDALVAYSLGVHWMKRNNTVYLLGSESTGTFLVPFDEDLATAFDKFCKLNSI